MNNNSSERIKSKHSSLFLPDFCAFKMVFTVLVIGELLAFILTLAPLDMDQQRWNDLALISLFIQWNGLMCSASLCLLRPIVKNYSNQFVAVSSYFSLLFMIALISELSFYIMEQNKILDLISASTHWEFLIHNVSIGGIIGALALRYFYVQHQWRIKMEAENNTRLKLLQARIRPHFLFNSLNSIASLTRSRPKVAEKITEDLAELFRMLIREDHELISWAREKELSQHYIDIEKQRLGERLQIHWYDQEMPENAMIPALLIQPLLENAIFHGIEPEIEGGQIMVQGELIDHHLKIVVQNTNSKNLVQRQGNKMALDNIAKRLEAHFQKSAHISSYEKDDIYYVVVIMPYQQKLSL